MRWSARAGSIRCWRARAPEVPGSAPAPFTAACITLRAGRDPAANVDAASALIREAAAAGAGAVFTPENTLLMELDRARLFAAVRPEAETPAVSHFAELAGELGIWLNIGSMAIRVAADKVANRSFLFAPDGGLTARYDKIHMFDVALPGGESYRESTSYAAGDRAVLAPTPLGAMGLTICYDLRFPALYRQLAQAGAIHLTVPSAFTRVTGEAHWHVLLRARAIETGSFVFAAAQSGRHETGRETYGHSLIVDPWGEVLADGGTEPGIVLARIDPAKSAEARARIPSLATEAAFTPAAPAAPEDLPDPAPQAMKRS